MTHQLDGTADNDRAGSLGISDVHNAPVTQQLVNARRMGAPSQTRNAERFYEDLNLALRSSIAAYLRVNIPSSLRPIVPR